MPKDAWYGCGSDGADAAAPRAPGPRLERVDRRTPAQNRLKPSKDTPARSHQAQGPTPSLLAGQHRQTGLSTDGPLDQGTRGQTSGPPIGHRAIGSSANRHSSTSAQRRTGAGKTIGRSGDTLAMAKVFCIANQKGGVGKTTTTVNLAAGLARVDQRVLVVDLDPQGNATMGSGIDKRAMPLSIYDVLLESASIVEARQRSESGGYDVLGANRELAGAEVELVALEHRNERLRRALADAATDAAGAYDFVLIDCPPSLSLLTLNGLCSAHGVIVPMQCEYFALEGLSDLVNTIKQVHANLNRNLQIIGLLRVMFDPRITLQQQVSEQLKSHFGDKVFNAVIPRNVRLAEAPSYGQPGVVFDPASKGAVAYVDFARELVRRVGSLQFGA